jgi:hypothetical protein
MSMDIDTEIAHLYGLPLGEFVDARNQLAARLRPIDRKAAAEVKKLAKPSISAWAVNQAYWNAREEFETMLDAGDELRALQTRALGGERPTGVQAAMAAQRSALLQVVKQATRALAQAGYGSSNAVLRRVVTTLEALASYGRAGSAPRPGRLSADVPAPGFDALAGLAGLDALAATAPGQPAATAPGQPAATAPRVPRATTANDNMPQTEGARQAERARQAEGARQAEEAARRAAREQARAAVDQARRALEARRQALGQVTRTEKEAQGRVSSADKAVAAAEHELARAVAVRERAAAGAEQARHEVEQAAAAVVAAEDALRAAQAALAEIE